MAGHLDVPFKMRFERGDRCGMISLHCMIKCGEQCVRDSCHCRDNDDRMFINLRGNDVENALESGNVANGRPAKLHDCRGKTLAQN